MRTRSFGKKATSRASPQRCGRAEKHSSTVSASRRALRSSISAGGDGTIALPAAALGADVLGVDIAANLVEAGNRRAREQGLSNCTFQEGDATNLRQLQDKSFDLVVGIFGAMFAPKPFDAAKEIVRVTRPGGRILMGNWIPNDPTLVARILKTCARPTHGHPLKASSAP
jgi:SAM-dependent methyltransferase